ncbi:MAG: fibronectin type III domain-containing protein, partial [Candidatus Thermoplasmatota archaeon]|nr:fibronectin type III domain-containing protein [Candidatus Thermoplasmatota archaeon]
GPPRDISFTSEDSFINLSWREPLSDGGEEIISYRIYRGMTSNDLQYMDRVDPDVFFYNDTTVTNGMLYHFGIRAENRVSRGEWGYITAVASTRPGAPTIYRIDRSDGSLNVSWFRPLDDGGIDEIHYSVYFGDSIASMELLTTEITDEWYNISGLVNGRTYYVAVSASNWRGTGPLSEIWKGIPMTPPSKPRDLKGDISPFNIHLTWLPPEEKGGSQNITYNVYMGQNLSSIETVASSLNSTSADIPVGIIGVQMTVFVRAVNELGPGEPSDHLNITPLGDLSRPMNLTALEMGDHILLSWKPPTYRGGAENITYMVYSGPDPGNLTILMASASDHNISVSPVVPGKEYWFAVSAYNGYWESRRSDLVNATPFQTPSPPIDLMGTIGNRFVNLSWSTPTFLGGDTNVSYELYTAIGNGSFSHRWLNTNNTLVRGLENGMDYTFYVRAINVKGMSLPSNIIILRPMSVPSPPRNPYYVDYDGSLNISWATPMDKGGSRLITYTLFSGPAEDDLVPIAEGISDLFYIITGLTNGVRYYIRVAAVNEIGSSEPSEMLIGIPMKLPSSPRNLNITWQEGGVLIKWDPPQDNGGGEIWIYHVQRGLDPDSMIEIAGVSGSFREYLDIGAVEGTIYFYCISCETTKGTGPSSEVFELRPPPDEADGLDLRIPVIIGIVALVILLVIVALFMVRRSRRHDWGIEE